MWCKTSDLTPSLKCVSRLVVGCNTGPCLNMWELGWNHPKSCASYVHVNVHQLCTLIQQSAQHLQHVVVNVFAFRDLKLEPLPSAIERGECFFTQYFHRNTSESTYALTLSHHLSDLYQTNYTINLAKQFIKAVATPCQNPRGTPHRGMCDWCLPRYSKRTSTVSYHYHKQIRASLPR